MMLLKRNYYFNVTDAEIFARVFNHYITEYGSISIFDLFYDPLLLSHRYDIVEVLEENLKMLDTVTGWKHEIPMEQMFKQEKHGNMYLLKLTLPEPIDLEIES